MEWLFLVIPLVVCAYLWRFHEHQVVWWELLSPIAIALVLILLGKYLGETIQTSDDEYWTGIGLTAEYYEDWDEKVPCTHDVYETDSKGNTRYKGKQHAYDVDYHPPLWQLIDNNGITVSVSSSAFEGLGRRWGNKTFVDLHRDYHWNDGDKYVTKWDSRDETLEVVTTVHTYENRVQAANSVYSFAEVSPSEVEANGLIDYPRVSGHSCPSILGHVGVPGRSEAERALSLLNAKMGHDFEVRAWILLYKDKPLSAAFAQEAFWKGGNMNELTLCIGVNGQNEVQWCHVISWTDIQEIKIRGRDFVSEQKGQPIDLMKVVNWLRPAIESRWKRKDFEEFSYLHVDPPWWMYLVTALMVCAATGAFSYWAVVNEYREGRRGDLPWRSAQLRRRFTA